MSFKLGRRARTMIERTEERFGLKSVRLAADTAYARCSVEYSRKDDTDCRKFIALRRFLVFDAGSAALA
jgi:hypothetical protein